MAVAVGQDKHLRHNYAEQVKGGGLLEAVLEVVGALVADQAKNGPTRPDSQSSRVVMDAEEGTDDARGNVDDEKVGSRDLVFQGVTNEYLCEEVA